MRPSTCRGGKEGGEEGGKPQCCQTLCVDCTLGYEHLQNMCDIVECTYVSTF